MSTSLASEVEFCSHEYMLLYEFFSMDVKYTEMYMFLFIFKFYGDFFYKVW
jgi:hypothetical protein